MSLIRVDFYLLASDEEQARWTFACRVLQKAYVAGHKVYVFCSDQKDAEFIDELLWTFKEDSFVPHNLQGEGPEIPPPVQIGYGKAPKEFHDILLNLANSIPTFYTQFKRVIELVINKETEKTQGRSHYRDYKAKGCDLYTHRILS